MWSYKTLRSNAWKTAFRKGFMAWAALFAVCFLFSFLGADGGGQTSFQIDNIGIETAVSQDNMEIIDTYIADHVTDKMGKVGGEVFSAVVNAFSSDYSWLVNLLAANFAYFKRNSGEVIAMLLITGFILGAAKLFIQNVLVIGKCRYCMEARFQKKTLIRRSFAPFHKKYLKNEIKVMIIYNLTLAMWALTFVGWVYKSYQYRMVPYLLAENPQISWREAKTVSKQMTAGYKMKMFLTDLSFIYIWILKAVPIAGLAVALPLEAQLKTETYFYLRERSENKDSFVEEGFNAEPFVVSQESVESFSLDDTVLTVDELRGSVTANVRRLRGEYNLIDYIAFFFAFAFVGWAWEVLLYLVRDHVLVNRGTLYGPWLPIYGVGGVIIIFLLGHFKANKGKLFVLGMLLCGVVEYAASWVLDYFSNASYWDYHSDFMNLNGRIYLVGLVAFGLGGLFGVYIAAPRISVLLDKIGRKKSITICATLAALFIADLICVAIFGFNSGEGVGKTL